MSDTVTKATRLNSNIEYLSINEAEQNWSQKIEMLISGNRASVDNTKVIEQFDIRNLSKQLEEIYLS